MCLSAWLCLFTVASLCVLHVPVFTHPQNDPINENWDSADTGLSISNDEILSDFRHWNGLPDSAYFVPSSTDRERRKRAVFSAAAKLVQLGKAAVTRLRIGTIEIPSTDKRIRKFVKAGNLEDALRDFRAVKPTYTSTFRRYDGVEIVEGRAGDKLILVNSRGEQGMPTITIIDFNKAKTVYKKQRGRPTKATVTGQPIDRIIYKETMKTNVIPFPKASTE